MSLTITEALAEIKTIGSRIAKKREHVLRYLVRQEAFKDPLEKRGGSFAAIQSELQSIGDLEKEIIRLRRLIAKANDTTTITVGSLTMTISEWLTWRREVSPGRQQFFSGMLNQLKSARSAATQRGAQVVIGTSQPAQPTDFIVNVNEATLAAENEELSTVLGQLDGQLSLKNATVVIDAE